VSERILKYELPGPDCVIDAVAGHPLSVGMQGASLVVWLRTNAEAREVRRRFVSVNTGDEFAGGPLRYIGTATSGNGVVWHVFEGETDA